jgi:hypothetical protein
VQRLEAIAVVLMIGAVRGRPARHRSSDVEHRRSALTHAASPSSTRGREHRRVAVGGHVVSTMARSGVGSEIIRVFPPYFLLYSIAKCGEMSLA